MVLIHSSEGLVMDLSLYRFSRSAYHLTQIVIKVVGDSVFNLLSIGELEVDENDKPLYPASITHIDVLHNPLSDIELSIRSKPSTEPKDLVGKIVTKKPTKRLFSFWVIEHYKGLCIIFFKGRHSQQKHLFNLLILTCRAKGLISFEDDLVESEGEINVKRIKSSYDLAKDTTETLSETIICETKSEAEPPTLTSHGTLESPEKKEDYAIRESNNNVDSTKHQADLEIQMYVFYVLMHY